MSSSDLKYSSLSELNANVISCNKCSRLRRYCERIARIKRRQFREWEYWGKPIPGFGDPRARLLILGLAPAAHGGNRTGRMFTGDGSAQFLIPVLYKFGFANQATSVAVNDGLVLKDAYMTAIVRCAPPKNKPTLREIETCQGYWTLEVQLLANIAVVLALGRVAFDTYVRHLRSQGLHTKLAFKHGAFFKLPSPYPVLCASYHPSRQNTQTGRLTARMFDNVFKQISEFLTETSNIL
ncbi:MAG: uracil-DNA glycosylase [Candidatus Bathyarchaeia archaeon]|jgi:uracil-DNA glycosylase family 4